MKKQFQIDIELNVPDVHKGNPIYPDNEICQNLKNVLLEAISFGIEDKRIIDSIKINASVKKSK